MVTDEDNMDAAIVKSVSSVLPPARLTRSFVMTLNYQYNLRYQGISGGYNNRPLQLERKDRHQEHGRNNRRSTDKHRRAIAPTLKIYPNPAVNSIQINIDTPAEIEIYTSRGTMVRNPRSIPENPST